MSLNTAHPDQYKEENGVRGEEDENRNLSSGKNDQSRKNDGFWCKIETHLFLFKAVSFFSNLLKKNNTDEQQTILTMV